MEITARERLYEEFDQLKDRVARLQKFVGSPRIKVLPEVERNDLRSQLVYMKAYLKVLERRRGRVLDLFEDWQVGEAKLPGDMTPEERAAVARSMQRGK